MDVADGTMITLAAAVILTLFTMLWQGRGSAKEFRAEMRHQSARMDKLFELINELVRDVGEIKNGMSHLQRDIGEIREDVSHLKREVSEIREDVSRLQRDVRDLTERVGRLEDRFAVPTPA